MQEYQVLPGSVIDLSHWHSGDRRAFDGNKAEAKVLLGQLNERLAALQEVLYAEGKHKVLIVLQAMDTGGKDGAIRHVFRGVNPQGVKVTSFKKPTEIELAHDYLWRIHPHTPGNGEIAIFNRSYYEDVLVVRVRNLVPQAVWSRRYEHINAFEKMLADEGTTILKFFLHISKEEQKKRLQSRLDDPHKRWKFHPGDLEERALWSHYTEAYEAVLSQTSTEWASWHIIPGDRKWYRNLMISQIIIEKLESLDMRYPEPEGDLEGIVIED
jgi:PPK2 family polyphosphate:nucleotide phosphotransferase